VSRSILFALAFATSAAVAMAMPAQAAETASGRYEISIGGLQLGVAGLEGRLSNDSYETTISVRLSGISKLVASGRGHASAQGRFVAGRAVPTSYSLDLTTTQQSDVIRMAMAGGNIRTLSVEPERPPAPDAVPLTMGHRQGVIDPLAGALFFASAQGLTPDACARTFPVFDGRQRYDLSFSFSRMDTMKVTGYDGPVIVCQARYKPIAGHRPAATAEMERNRDMELSLAPVAGTRVLVPARISIRTPMGIALIEATRLELGAPSATATVRR
jgi:hypothetical protein